MSKNDHSSSKIPSESVDLSVYIEDDGALQKAINTFGMLRREMKISLHHAAKRASESGKIAVAKELEKDYTLSKSLIRQHTKSMSHVRTEYVANQTREVSVVFGYRGYVIPLIKFNTIAGVKGKISANVKRDNMQKSLYQAFKADIGNHTGIFERVGRRRKPIKELFGPSVPSMLSANQDLLDRTGKDMAETFEKRLDHEIYRKLNGYGD